MKMYFAAWARNAMWSLTSVILAGLVSLPLTAQDAAGARKEAEVPAFYHLLYTLTESEGGKRIGIQTFVLTISSDREAASSELRVGSRIPYATGSGDPAVGIQFNYADVGLTIQARSQKPFPGGLEVFASVEQSFITEPPPDNKIHQPVIRNYNLHDVAVLYPNTPVSLGAFDVPGNSRHYEGQVTLQAIR